MTPDPAATPTPAPTPEGTATPEPTPQALASDFDASDSRRDGTIAFNPPARMRVGEATRVQARISPKTTEAIERQITEKMKGAGAGQPQTRPVKITAVMSLRLSGRDFSITSYSDDKQKIFDPFTTWEWDIAPTSPGTKQLSLTIVTYVEGGDATISAVEDWTVEVDVTIGHRIGEFMTKYWQWMATAVIFPLGIWVTNFVLRRRRNAPTG
jgi:hypothetical protein